MDRRASLAERALAVQCALGIGLDKAQRQKSDLSTVLGAFHALGAPDELVTATGAVAQKTREPVTLMVPLIWLAANCDGLPTISQSDMPATKVVDDVPMYALDKHTRLGRKAIRQFVSGNHEVREDLARYIPLARCKDAAYMAVFHADAATLANKLDRAGADELEVLGTEADMHKVGVPLEGIQPLLEAFQNNLDHLNVIRADVFIRSRQGSSAVEGPLALRAGCR